MGRRYSINGDQNVASPTDTVLGLTSASTIRPRIYDLIIGSTATPADNALQWLLQRYTAAGAGSSVTPMKLDPGDPVSLASALSNHGTEPTYTAGEVVLDVPMNQRSSQRWVAAQGGEIIIPATANNGVGVQPVHASFTGLVNACIHFEE